MSASHSHIFDEGNPLAEKKVLIATLFTGAMMLVEIVGGILFNSMALLADGWHMSSHMLALGVAYLAYRAARRYAQDPRFCFGTWKIEILAGHSSAIALMGVALMMGFHSIERLFNPLAIHYNEAIPIAVLGLVVNIVCLWLLHTDSHHQHKHEHHEQHHHHHHHEQDLNQKAAFLHIVADAATSVFAIIALIAGKYFGWDFLDAVLGIIGALLVGKWSWNVLSQAGKTLLDAEMDAPVVAEIREVLASFETTVTDLHVWKVGKGKFACIIALNNAAKDLSPAHIRQALSIHEEIVHISVEINPLLSTDTDIR